MGALIIRLPFEGFYESRYSQEVDHWQEMDAEHFAEQDREEQPKELQLSDSEFGEILFDCADYSSAYLSVAHAYVDAFNIGQAGFWNCRSGSSSKAWTARASTTSRPIASTHS